MDYEFPSHRQVKTPSSVQCSVGPKVNTTATSLLSCCPFVIRGDCRTYGFPPAIVDHGTDGSWPQSRKFSSCFSKAHKVGRRTSEDGRALRSHLGTRPMWAPSGLEAATVELQRGRRSCPLTLLHQSLPSMRRGLSACSACHSGKSLLVTAAVREIWRVAARRLEVAKEVLVMR